MRKHEKIHAPGRATVKDIAAPLLALVCASVSTAAGAGQIDLRTFSLFHDGMTASEVLVRAGPPDLVTSPGEDRVEVFSGAVLAEGESHPRGRAFRHVQSVSLLRWHYIPDRSEHDPYLTVVTFRRGLVFSLERKKIFSRAGLPGPPAASAPQRRSDSEIVRKRLERTLEAAERYARTRARLKREDLELRRAAAELPRTGVDDAELRIYRSEGEDGSVYYGDRPPGGAPGIVEH